MLSRCPCKVFTHTIPLVIGLHIFRDVDLARSITEAHGYWNTFRERE
jgi:hypothetical protein